MASAGWADRPAPRCEYLRCNARSFGGDLLLCPVHFGRLALEGWYGTDRPLAGWLPSATEIWERPPVRGEATQNRIPPSTEIAKNQSEALHHLSRPCCGQLDGGVGALLEPFSCNVALLHTSHPPDPLASQASPWKWPSSCASSFEGHLLSGGCRCALPSTRAGRPT